MNRHEYPGSYDDVVKALRRLEKAEQVKCLGRPNRYVPNLWSRPSVKPVSPELRRHEEECGWLFVSFWPSDHVDYWDWKWTEEEVKEYQIHRGKSFAFDRRMKYKGVWVFLEHDRGSRTEEKVAQQLQNYARFADRVDIKFHVVYTLTFGREGQSYPAEYVKQKIAERAKFLLSEFRALRHGKQFAVARYADVARTKDRVTDPFGAHYVTALDPRTPLTLDQLIS